MTSYFSDSDPCWLRPQNLAPFRGAVVGVLAQGPIADTLTDELAHAVGSSGRVVRDLPEPPPQLLLARHDLLAARVGSAGPNAGPASDALAAGAGLATEGFAICGDGQTLAVVAPGERGLLYGFFHLLRLGPPAWNAPVRAVEEPALGIRMINQWDNVSSTGHHGSVERGYAGDSIFFRDNRVVADKHRIRDYARLLASVGINAISINNVNVSGVATRLLSDQLDDVAEVAAIFRGFGIATYLSVSFAAPILSGELTTADPLDADVASWWQRTATRVHNAIPDFGGFLVKADSEGQPGPFFYGRDHVDGANLLADALAPSGGTVFWRCFVYNHRQDWRDRSTDRARAAYDHFLPLDGRFADNVVLQAKFGPMDFQVREPVSPLILGLHETNLVVEFQLTQEYTGHQIDLCYLPPLWHESLAFPTSPRAGSGAAGSTVASTLVDRGRTGARTGVTAVSNIGDDENWTGHALAQANLYGFGRLAWSPLISPDEVLDEWIRLTFDDRDAVHATVRGLQRTSWPTYESYTAPLGVGWMVTPHTHYGPSIDGYEYSRWGTYHFADRDGIGVDRTVRTGTGFAGQYPPEWAEVYESLQSCPDELLLFFHHVPYTHVLHSGKTVIQHIYDTHFEGAERVAEMRDEWRRLAGEVDQAVYSNVLERLDRQVESAREWRDQVNTYFLRKSGIPDAQGRTIY